METFGFPSLNHVVDVLSGYSQHTPWWRGQKQQKSDHCLHYQTLTKRHNNIRLFVSSVNTSQIVFACKLKNCSICNRLDKNAFKSSSDPTCTRTFASPQPPWICCVSRAALSRGRHIWLDALGRCLTVCERNQRATRQQSRLVLSEFNRLMGFVYLLQFSTLKGCQIRLNRYLVST